METTIKEIIAPFLGMQPIEIGTQTPLNRNSLKSSIHLHRMYAKLNSNGFIIEDYSNISTFGDLINKIDGKIPSMVPSSADVYNVNDILNESNLNIGIDAEDITSMPETSDFRNHEFYVANFTANEISYCILQKNPYASFAGLFAVKEALIKSNNALAALPFNTINIDHSEKGKPLFKDYSISISHSSNIAIAVVISPLTKKGISDNIYTNEIQPGNNKASALSILAILLSAFSLLIILLKK